MSKRRAGRTGVNPQDPTEKIQIPSVTVPKFKAGKGLKDALKAAQPSSFEASGGQVAEAPGMPAEQSEPPRAPEQPSPPTASGNPTF